VNPQRLGSRYLLHDRLGQGAMGVVWRGQDLETGAWVAVKLLRPDYATSPAAVSRFVGERNALIRFRHPNVVNLRDMIVEGDRLALVMDLITGGDLETFRLHSGGALAPPVAVRVTAQICDGLAAAHAAGIIHRDLKPSNVLVQAGQVKLADFGISRIAGEARRTTTGTVMGTPTYLAPEAINGAEPTSACDVYAAGITLYELLTGQPPFDGHVVAVMQAHLQREAERIPGISVQLWDLIAGCLSKDPAGRPTAAALAGSLKALQENADALGPGPAPSALQPAPAHTAPQLSQLTVTERAVQTPVPAAGGLAQPPILAGGGPAQPPGPIQAQGLAQSPSPAQTLLPAQAPSPTQSGAFPVPPTPPGQQGPLAVPALGDGRRKRLLAGLAALVVVIAVAATVYATAFSGKSTTSQTGGALSTPTLGGASSSGLPTPSGTRVGQHHLHTGGHTAGPTPTDPPSSVKPTRPAGHPHSSPPATPHTSPPASTSSSPASTATPTNVPFGEWACGSKITIAGSGKTLVACIRVVNNQLQIQGTLTNASAGETIGLAVTSTNPAEGVLGDYTSPACKANLYLCTYTATVTNAPAGKWYVVPVALAAGATAGTTGAPSPVINFTGL
jgi:serine/threonine protein kinase, bacterial